MTASEAGNEDRGNLIIALGVAVGFSSAFLGIGGGLLLVPVLTTVLRCPVRQAIGTSLAVIFFVSSAGVLAEWEVHGGSIRWAWALLLGAGSLAGAAAGRRLVPRVPDTAIRLTLAAILLAASYRMTQLAGSGPPGTGGAVSPAAELWMILLVGLVAGLASVLFGLGGGIITVPALWLLSSELAFHAIRGTSLAAILIAAILGMRRYLRVGHVNTPLVRALVPAGLTGAVLGVIAASFAPASLWQMAWALLLLVVVVVALRPLSPALWPGEPAAARWRSPLRSRHRRADLKAP